MTYQAATNPDEFYREARLDYQPDFEEIQFKEVTASDWLVRREGPSVSYSWAF